MLLEEDPRDSLNKTGTVYAKLGKAPDKLKNEKVRSIFSYDNKCWELYNQT